MFITVFPEPVPKLTVSAFVSPSPIVPPATSTDELLFRVNEPIPLFPKPRAPEATLSNCPFVPVIAAITPVVPADLPRTLNPAIDHTSGTNGLVSVLSSGTNSTSAKTTIGANIRVINTGTTSTNIGLYVEASGASTNRSIRATGTSEFGTISNIVSITLALTATGTERIDITGVRGVKVLASGKISGTTTNANTQLGSSAVITDDEGANVEIIGNYTNAGIPSVSGASVIRTPVTITHSSGSPSGLVYRIFYANPTYNFTSVTSGYVAGFVYEPTITSLTNTTNYAFISSSGRHGFGTLTPASTVTIKSYGTTTGESFRIDDSSSTNRFLVLDNGNISVTKGINTTAGDSATINAVAGRFRKDTSGTTFTLTNSFITANSILILDQANAAFDATATSWTKSCGAGSATITFNAAPTANFDMDFIVLN